MNETSKTHPDFGDLEAYRRGEADETMIAHVTACAECQFSLAELEDLVAAVRDDSLPKAPEWFDDRIRGIARQNAARVRRENRRANMQRWAIAATVLLSVAGVGAWLQMNRANAPGPQPSLDIVDALTLARQLAAAQPTDLRYDANHDGRVDRADLDSIMHQVVAVRGA